MGLLYGRAGRLAAKNGGLRPGGQSRNSFMSGRRPDSSNIYSFIGTFRDPASGQNWVALPEQFVRNGYNVGGSGKLFHPGVPANFDQPWSWTVPYQELGDNATNMCEDFCCGVNDVNSTGGPGQEGKGYIRLSHCSTAQPLYARFPIIFGSCFSKVTLGYYPRKGRATTAPTTSRPAPTSRTSATRSWPATTSGRSRRTGDLKFTGLTHNFPVDPAV